MKKILMVIIFIVISSGLFALNKMRVKDMDWNIYETQHFKIYYYKSEAFLARLAAIYAEDGYLRDTQVLDYALKEKIPLFLYENHMDFTSTNITLSFLGEGTGGFTEPFKNRIALPGSGSFESLREVVYHEITHAMQFGIMFGEGMRSYNVLYKNAFVPLWVMEGMAEYCAQDFDSRGDMVLRDAVIKGRLIPPGKLEGFNHLEEVYLAYKEAQSIFSYIAKKYGEDKIAKIAGKLRDEVNIQSIIKQVLKIDFKDFEEDWMFYLRKKYWAQIQGRDDPEKYGPKLTEDDHNHIVYNSAPEFSPDGRNIIFLSSRDGHRDIYIMRNDGKEVKKLWDRFESISTDGFPFSWSSDNKHVFFVSSKRGKRYIYKGNIETGDINEIAMEGITNLYSPAVSPDEKYIAFIGVVEGFSDVYLYELESGKVKNVTRNVFENNSVRWSAAGDKLIFTEERKGFKRLAVFDLKKGSKKIVTKEESYDYENPRFISDTEIVFTSDKNGIFNLYKMDFEDNKEVQLTNVINGIFYPSVNGDYITYSYYDDACYNIYKYLVNAKKDFAELPLNYSEDIVKEDKSVKYLVRDADVVVAETFEPRDDMDFVKQIQTESDKIIISDTKYETTFTPDLVFALLGIGTDMGVAGGGYFQISDMLGDHNATVVLNAMPGYYTQFDFSYLFLGFPFDIGTRFFYYQNKYNLYDVDTQEFFSQLDSTELGGNLQLNYALNLFNSVGITFGSRKIDDKYTNLETENTYVFPGDETDILNTAAIYFQADYSAWRDFWPYSGDSLFAYAEVSEKMFGGTKSYDILEVDYRKHFDLSMLTSRNTSVSARLLMAMTSGEDRPYFVVGGINTIRGLGYGSYSGDKVALLNIELRHTLAKNINFEIWPFNFLMVKNLKVSFFSDSGLARKGSVNSVVAEEVRHGVGAGVVLDTFLLQKQYTPLKFEVAKRVDVSDNIWKFYFSINTNF